MIVVVCCMIVFFFFKQKTAYEMRISDWSSDVCSSDLAAQRHGTDEAAPLQRREHSQVGEFGEQEGGRGSDDQRRRREGRREGGAHHDRGERPSQAEEIGRASCREGVCQYV